MSTTSISRSRMLETYAVPLPLIATAYGNSPPATPACAGSIFPGRRSSSALLAPATRSTTLIESFSKFATTSFFPSRVTSVPAECALTALPKPGTLVNRPLPAPPCPSATGVPLSAQDPADPRVKVWMLSSMPPDT